MKFEYREIPDEPARNAPLRARNFMVESAAETSAKS